jgi:hypothetical protein
MLMMRHPGVGQQLGSRVAGYVRHNPDKGNRNINNRYIRQLLMQPPIEPKCCEDPYIHNPLVLRRGRLCTARRMHCVDSQSRAHGQVIRLQPIATLPREPQDHLPEVGS